MRPVLTDGSERRWTIYVDEMEVADHLMIFDVAGRLADKYLADGYGDIVLKQYDTGEEVRIA